MGAKTSEASQIISLPKGGGALQGIGEKFAPDLFTGTGNFTVPISLPPGRNGFQPKLSLVYSTGNGNGPFGLGWALSIPGVSRKTAKGVPRYRDAEDTFVLSGVEDLVPVSGNFPGSVQYRPRTEGLFARIQRSLDPNTHDDYWEVCSKDGLISRYGTPGMWENDSAVIADPANRRHVFAWKLTETTDPFGNRILYEYERNSAEEGPHHWDQLYLKHIRYVDYTVGNKTTYLVSVTFHYEDEDRPDPFSDYRAGFEIRTTKRCRHIEIKTHAADVERLVKTYTFVYVDQRQDIPHITAQLPVNGTSLLSQVQVTGHDDQHQESLPPLEFGYSQFEPKQRDFFPLKGDAPLQSLVDPNLELVDLFGTGLPDIIETNATVRYWRNLGEGKFDMPREMSMAPAGLQLAQQGVQLIDANGNGRTDLLVTTPEISGYYPLSFDGSWDRRSFQRYETAPSFDLEAPEVRLVDLDGNGVTDVIRSGSRLECFFNHPKSGWSETSWVERQQLSDFSDANFANPRVRWADMSGDNLQDIVLVYDGNIEYWPNLGHGNWGKRISMRNSPRFPHGYDPNRILIGDVDGDGVADLMYVDHRKVMLWINNNGNGWSNPIEIDGTPPVSNLDGVRLTDLLGTGVASLLWSKDADIYNNRAQYYFLDFTGGVKPYLLSRMDNHMGATTEVEYRPSTHYYLQDQRRPETRWKTPLPFPVQVVATVTAIDEFSKGKLTTEYFYHHGYWDGAEREFRGFGRVDQRDTELFQPYHANRLAGEQEFQAVEPAVFSPPTETRTWFHQGPIGDEFGAWEEADYGNEFWSGDPNYLARDSETNRLLRTLERRDRRDALRTLRGSILRTELYALDGHPREERPYTVTESLFGLREEQPLLQGDSSRQRIFFPHALSQRTTQWERGDEPMTQFGFTEDYDEYGLPQTQTQIACPRSWRNLDDMSDEYLATRSKTEYARPQDAQQTYIMDRVAKTTAFEIKNNGPQQLLEVKSTPDTSPALEVFGQTLSFYDGDAFQGLPFKQAGPYGALVRTETLVLTRSILRQAYRSGENIPNPPEAPPYLSTLGQPPWTPDYPQEFRNALPELAGYHYRAGGAGSPYETGFFAATQQQCYDFQVNAWGIGRGLVIASRDPLDHETRIDYDLPYNLLPIRVTDPIGLETHAVYDYRVLQAREAIDQNDNHTVFTFTPLGLPRGIAVTGQAHADEGDPLAYPDTIFQYDFLAYENSPADQRLPVYVHTIKREDHVWELIHEENTTRANNGQPPLTQNEIQIRFPVIIADELIQHSERFIQTREYTDGFGRLLQTRTQAEEVVFYTEENPPQDDPLLGDANLPADDQTDAGGPATGHENGNPAYPRVVVSGWQEYDNKGQVIRQCEPFFSTGWPYVRPQPQMLQKLASARSYYDPRGQVVRPVNPDGSGQLILFGNPRALDTPHDYLPTPWESYTYDVNDNAGRTHAAESGTFRHHWDTPSNIEVDALGRVIRTIERNRERQNNAWSPIIEYITESNYDIRGNVTVLIDALNREAFRYVYDLANNPLRSDSIDGGVRRTILDAAGNVIEQHDSKGSLVLNSYDQLNRPNRMWAKDNGNQNEPLSLREYLIYGDEPASGFDRNQARSSNLLGRLYQHYDEAGRLTFSRYDFKGNNLEKNRQVISNQTLLASFDPQPPDWQVLPFRVDWPANAAAVPAYANNHLDQFDYLTTVHYDALNRIKELQLPQDADNQRKIIEPHYNRAGALERVSLNGAIYAERIAYSAKGQRLLIAYGNGVMTRYAYDPQTFRLKRLRTERYTKQGATTYRPRPTNTLELRQQNLLQDFAYDYDLTGNILSIHDRTPNCGIPDTPSGTQALDRDFNYDPIYRLISATGRECKPPAPIPPSRKQPWNERPKCHNVNDTRAYTQEYSYDRAGNFHRLRHRAGVGGFNRLFTLVADNNRLDSLIIGNNHFAYGYDNNGNLVRENTERHFEWDHSDRMRVFRTQPSGAEPSVYAYYLYDSNRQRVKKLVRDQGGNYRVTVYSDGVFEHHRLSQGANTQENNRIHVMDDASRIALVRVGNAFQGDSEPVVQYHFGDHLGSSNVVISGDSNWINREEHYPYGGTSFGSFARKRYRFIGKERDEESGLYYHGARYYAPWLGRWTSCDPAGLADGANVYTLNANNPIMRIDRLGMSSESTDTLKAKYEKISQKQAELYRKREKLSQKKAVAKANVENHEELVNRADLDPTEPRGQRKIKQREHNLRQAKTNLEKAASDLEDIEKQLKKVTTERGKIFKRANKMGLLDRILGRRPDSDLMTELSEFDDNIRHRTEMEDFDRRLKDPNSPAIKRTPATASKLRGVGIKLRGVGLAIAPSILTYIVDQRLILAAEVMKSGRPPTEDELDIIQNWGYRFKGMVGGRAEYEYQPNLLQEIGNNWYMRFKLFEIRIERSLIGGSSISA